jgi:hypothetical protein
VDDTPDTCIAGNWFADYGFAANPVAGYAFADNWGAGYALPASQTPFMVDILVNTYVCYIFL